MTRVQHSILIFCKNSTPVQLEDDRLDHYQYLKPFALSDNYDRSNQVGLSFNNDVGDKEFKMRAIDLISGGVLPPLNEVRFPFLHKPSPLKQFSKNKNDPFISWNDLVRNRIYYENKLNNFNLLELQPFATPQQQPSTPLKNAQPEIQFFATSAINPNQHSQKRTIEPIGGANLLKRAVDRIGGGNLLKRAVDRIGGGNLLKRR